MNCEIGENLALSPLSLRGTAAQRRHRLCGRSESASLDDFGLRTGALGSWTSRVQDFIASSHVGHGK
eukprot:4894349-Prorocentrum_lima.AAC.1